MKLKFKDILPILFCFIIGGVVLFGSVVLVAMITQDEPSWKTIICLVVLILAGARYVRNKTLDLIGEAWWDDGR